MAVPERPEPKFFLRPDAEELGLRGYERRHFPAGSATPVLGEKSTSYIESEAAARRIRRVIPDAKLIFVLRDPVDRALSNYRFSVEHGVETEPLGEAFRLEDERRERFDSTRFSVSPYAYQRRGRYVDYLDVYRRHFPRESMKIVLFERLLSDREELVAVLGFLGVSSHVDLALPERPVNASSKAPGVEASEALLRGLRDRFRQPNRRLARSYDLDLSCWPSAVEPVAVGSADKGAGR